MNEIGKKYTMFWPVTYDSEGKALTIGMTATVLHAWGDSPRLCNARLFLQGNQHIIAYNLRLEDMEELYEERA